MHRLSKSKLISGWQCPKRLWIEKYDSEPVEYSAATLAMFAVGHQVGAIAQDQFPEGILVGHDFELSKALHQTEDLLAQPGPITIFEATFQHEGVLIRADVLVRDAQGAVRVIEVKSSASVKEYHQNDCAIQLWVLEGSGLKVDCIELAHIDTSFMYAGDGNYAGLLHYADVTELARSKQGFVPQLVSGLREVLDGPEPEIPMGEQCTKPFECPFIERCALAEQGAGAEMPVAWLGGGRSAVARYEAEGYRDIRDIPEDYFTKEKLEWMRRVTVTGEPELKPAAAAELSRLDWPRYYFDFETVGPAVPVFADTSPYGAYAFQWSCHVEHNDGRMEHRAFLADGTEKPTRACAEAMIAGVGIAGPVFVYSSFERSVINRFIRDFPDLTAALTAIRERLFDLLPLTQRNYYHPDMKGSWSIKAVLPTVAPDLSYGALDIVTVGTEAGIAWLEMLAESTAAERKAELRAALLEYCKLDTLAMVRLAWFLEGKNTDV